MSQSWFTLVLLSDPQCGTCTRAIAISFGSGQVVEATPQSLTCMNIHSSYKNWGPRAVQMWLYVQSSSSSKFHHLCPTGPLYYVHQTILSCLGKHRAVASGLVCLVLTGPLFPSLVACLVLQISTITRRMPMQCTQADRWHVEIVRWLQTVWK